MPKEEETTVREVLQVRYGEIFLKGLNRPTFLRMLVDRVRDAVKAVGGHVWLSDGRIYVSDAADMDEAIRRVTKVFGVHSVCRAIEMEKDSFEALCAQAAKLMEGYQGTFKVSARRSDKRYPMDSPTINVEMGAYLLEHLPGLKVDVKNPEVVLSVEIRDLAYLYTHPIPAVGGMPVGSNGKATLLLSGGIDSPVAGAWMRCTSIPSRIPASGPAKRCWILPVFSAKACAVCVCTWCRLPTFRCRFTKSAMRITPPSSCAAI